MEKETYFRPENLKEASELLNKLQEKEPRLLAGGTDIMVKRQSEYLDIKKPFKEYTIIDINKLKQNEIDMGSINLINENGEKKIEIGALSTYTDILESKIIYDYVPIIAKASYSVGGHQIQNMGTIGGMLGTATPAGDVTLALLVLEADVVFYSIDGYRTVSLDEYFIDYRKTVRKPNEVIVKIIVRPQTQSEKYSFKKVGGRKGQVIALCGFCARLLLSKEALINKAFISGASIAPYSIRIKELESFLQNKPLSKLKDYEDNIATIIDKSISPIDEIIATADYKRYVIKNLILDFLLNRI